MATVIGNKIGVRVIVLSKATNVGVWCGPNLIAAATLGGRWTEVAAMKEFIRLPNRFKPAPGLSQEALVSFGKLAA
jgi:hypothetical protein